MFQMTVSKNKYLWNMLEIKGREVVEVLSALDSPLPNQTDFRYGKYGLWI